MEHEAQKWAGVSEIMWGTLAHELAHQADELPAFAAALDAPLLILVGEQDQPFVRASQLMAEAIPDAQMVVIPDAGHSPQTENADAWIAALAGYLSSLPTVAR